MNRFQEDRRQGRRGIERFTIRHFDDPEEEEDRLLADHLDDFERQFDFILTPHLDRRVRHLNVHHRSYSARLMQRGGAALIDVNRRSRTNLPQEMERAIHRAINEQVLQDPEVRPNDFLLININSNRLHHAYHSARLRVREWQQNTVRAREVLEQISRMLNSNEQFKIDNTFSLHISHIQDPGRGGGRKSLGTAPIEKLLQNKKSVVYINNTDELCCARALVTVKAFRDLGSQHQEYRNLQKGFPVQKTKAQDLHRAAGVPEGPCGLSEIRQFQEYLVDYQIVVVSVEHAYQVIYKGPNQPEEKQLILVKHGEHFHGCHSLKGFFGKGYYCLDCEKGFNTDDLEHHRCIQKKCPACHQSSCTDCKPFGSKKATMPCNDCQRLFFGQTCLDNHKNYQTEDGSKAEGKHKKSVCQTHKKCVFCNKVLTPYEIKNHHVCGTAECPSCKTYVNIHHHQCFIQNPKDLEKKKNKKKRKRKADGSSAQDNEIKTIFVYWDSETMQERGIHVPNLVCARTSSVPSPPYFILDTLYQQGHCPDQIVNGAKIISMTAGPHGNIVFKDSMCFLQMPLASFPKSFGLKELKKGFFPHFFNIEDHQEYVGSIPAKDYFDPESMSTERNQEFEKWYEEKQSDPQYVFNFKEELLAYCRSDVKLLQDGCETFCKEFKDIAGFNPMEKCLTIASACNLYYRCKSMPKNMLASEPTVGWHGQRKPYSYAAMEWLCYLERTTDHPIAHARNGGERAILCGPHTIYADGLDETNRIAYEFNGCYWHGCPKCHPNRHERHHKLDDRSMEAVYEHTQKRVRLLEQAGYRVVTMWECAWTTLKKENGQVQSIVDTLEITKPLEPRDAFFGGRTNAVKLNHAVVGEEKIHYVDFTSLYPWVNKNRDYPVGHPKITIEPEGTNIDPYFGLVKCTILPPHELYHPVLPYRSGGKLTFPLCKTCVKNEQPKSLRERSHACSHTEQERCLVGTWCTPELQEAVKQGYVIKHIHEVWHFPTKSNAMFKHYVNTFLKLKQEASGWPKWTGGDVDKQTDYINSYETQEGIRLDPSKIEHNPGKRSLAKMMLNSFWGKYGQQGNKTQVKAYTSPSEFFNLLEDDTKAMQTLRVVNPEMVEVVYKNVTDADPVQVNINIFVACFTTCWARLKLYQEGLSQLEPTQVLYFDTDSIIYSRQPKQPSLPLGDYLGDFTDELKNGDHIVEFASAGPKNYGYLTANGKVECKVRGFSLNKRGQSQLNFQILKNNVIQEVIEPLKEAREIAVFNPHKIVRDVNTKQLETLTEIKRYKLVFDKRVVDPVTFYSYPYGHTRDTLDEDDVMNIDILTDL